MAKARFGDATATEASSRGCYDDNYVELDDVMETVGELAETGRAHGQIAGPIDDYVDSAYAYGDYAEPWMRPGKGAPGALPGRRGKGLEGAHGAPQAGAGWAGRAERPPAPAAAALGRDQGAKEGCAIPADPGGRRRRAHGQKPQKCPRGGPGVNWDMVCRVCSETFAVDAIDAHLPECLVAAGAKGGPRCGEESFVVTAEGRGKRLIVRVAASANLDDLEHVVRHEWFDWDHLSAFVIGDKEYAWNERDAHIRGKPTMKETVVGDALRGVESFKYEYNFKSIKRVYLDASPVPAGAAAMKHKIDVVAERVDEKGGAGGRAKNKTP